VSAAECKRLHVTDALWALFGIGMLWVLISFVLVGITIAAGYYNPPVVLRLSLYVTGAMAFAVWIAARRRARRRS
jgi:hypothetical protein